jgi:hypothetical protein
VPVARIVLPILVLLSLLFATSGCTVQLSPPYDDATYKSLVDLNVRTETLFASLSGGGTAADFPTHKATYDQLIGGFSAARMAAASREVPAAGVKLASNTPLGASCADNPADCVDPTPGNLDRIIALLTAMRDAHQHGKLTRGLDVGGFKNQYETDMNLVLVFEAALKR